MKVEPAGRLGREEWNAFVLKHYPPIGGFMQAWEWGEFQQALGRNVERYLVTDDDGNAPIALFTLMRHALPLGLQYGYAARGPVVAASHQDKLADVCEAIQKWAQRELAPLIFLRLEPPVVTMPSMTPSKDFVLPSYYVQPRYNLAIALEPSEAEILGSFHHSTRSNVARAERRGVTVDIRTTVTPADYEHFTGMMRDTIQRNSGVNAYPSRVYFDALFATLLPSAASVDSDPQRLSIVGFYGSHDGEPAATHYVLFFGETATYLYGASYTKHLNSKVTTYLHWTAMQEGKRRGMKYYDLGGIDMDRWPKLTEFKRQFRGEEFEYAGNIDLPLRPLAYRTYNLFRDLKK